jgi:hypothetical protein
VREYKASTTPQAHLYSLAVFKEVTPLHCVVGRGRLWERPAGAITGHGLTLDVA